MQRYKRKNNIKTSCCVGVEEKLSVEVGVYTTITGVFFHAFDYKSNWAWFVVDTLCSTRNHLVETQPPHLPHTHSLTHIGNDEKGGGGRNHEIDCKWDPNCGRT